MIFMNFLPFGAMFSFDFVSWGSPLLTFLSRLACGIPFLPILFAFHAAGMKGGGAEEDDESEDDMEADFEFDLRKAFEDEEKTRLELADRIQENEKRLAAGETGFEKTLAQDYLACALDFQEEEEFEKTTEFLDRAVDLLSKMAAENPSEEWTRMLGLARLTYGVVLNDQGMWSEALAEYSSAEE